MQLYHQPRVCEIHLERWLERGEHELIEEKKKKQGNSFKFYFNLSSCLMNLETNKFVLV